MLLKLDVIEPANAVTNDQPKSVLFICTGNSARSILAEALLNYASKGRLKAYSAGSHPTGFVNPHALQALRDIGVPVAGARSKSWDEFATPDAAPMDFVLTVCDNAAGEVCPIWPGQPITAHWGLADPAAVEGTESAVQLAFRDTAIILKRRVDLMLALPLDRLNATAIQHQVRDIGKR